MKNILRTEEAAMFGLSLFLFLRLDIAWWWYPLLILTPDIGMIGYVVNNRVGAITYNLFHHKGIAVLLYMAGLYFDNQWVQAAGLILFGHSSLDRLLGYGLKYPDGFKHTHLGVIGPP